MSLLYCSEDTIEDGQKRRIGNDIASNRGLTKNRNRETKTPRMKHKKKYANALKKRSGAVRKMADKSKPYGGEASGVKKNLTRSTKLNF
jgi:U3 small nucleolar RNA-associated protein 3